MAPSRPLDRASHREILTPSSLNSRLQANFDQHVGPIWISGEIASVARPSSGHAYFSLKDANSLVKAVIWKSRLPRVGAPIDNGLKVLAQGSLTIYSPRGEYQLIIENLEPQGEGALRLAYEKLFNRLTAEGLFKPERRRPRPFWPKRVALITAAGGAARQDFLSAAVKRCPSASVSFYPTRVQGLGAAEEMAAALADLNQWGDFDLVVITRGGGSLEDLWAFNEEVLVRAVASSRLPVLAAIGHSTDLSLVELAADDRAITPTAAAEAVFPDQKLLRRQLGEWRRRLFASAQTLLAQKHERLATLKGRLFRFESRLFLERQRLDNLVESLAKAGRRYLVFSRQKLAGLTRDLAFRSPAQRFKRDRAELSALAKALPLALARRLTHQRRELEILATRLRLISPLGVLGRGYALVTTEGRVLRSHSQAPVGSIIQARLAQGLVIAQVTASLPDPESPKLAVTKGKR
ncbi:MAG: exodeoxyribonuclease VII large subunit [Deltaproteobacteria bacterium]|jgi:exodeoxyribonuclease VII large subunit|nr:exodeoxyribonuclease VII large subunit [Deltaproteobacteria bacterium]